MITEHQVEDAQMACRDIQTSCDKLAVNVAIFRFDNPTGSDQAIANGVRETVTKIQERLDFIKSILKQNK